MNLETSIQTILYIVLFILVPLVLFLIIFISRKIKNRKTKRMMDELEKEEQEKEKKRKETLQMEAQANGNIWSDYGLLTGLGRELGWPCYITPYHLTYLYFKVSEKIFTAEKTFYEKQLGIFGIMFVGKQGKYYTNTKKLMNFCNTVVLKTSEKTIFNLINNINFEINRLEYLKADTATASDYFHYINKYDANITNAEFVYTILNTPEKYDLENKNTVDHPSVFKLKKRNLFKETKEVPDSVVNSLLQQILDWYKKNEDNLDILVGTEIIEFEVE